MKYLRKFTALLAVLTLFCALWVPMVSAETAPAAQQAQSVLYGRFILEQLDNSETLLYAYDRLAAGLADYADYIAFDNSTHRLTEEEAYIVWDMVLADSGEYGSLVYSRGLSINSRGVCGFRPYYYDYDIDLFHQQMDARIAELTAGLEGKSDWEKSEILHDRMCEIVTYEMVGYHQTAIGSLLQGYSVCAGYARGYQMLLQAVGIPCFYISGTGDNGLMTGGHAWNLVMLDGEWYYTDVTWDDTDYVFEDGSHWIRKTWFNVDYDFISQDHFAGDENFDLDAYLPKGKKPALEIVYGDLNGDNNINNQDLVLMQQHLSGWDVTFDTAACDLNADGTINNQDLVLMQQYLSGWDVTLGAA